MTQNTKILLGLITCKRPRMLAELLTSLRHQTIFIKKVNVEIVIVDNDSNRTALPTYLRFQNTFPCKLSYLIEEERGIPFARNKVLDHAIATGAKFIAFIDDDETASPDWLTSLFTVISRTGVDAVQGPVVSQMPDGNLPSWAKKAKRKHANKREGARRKGLSTNNVIFKADLIIGKGLRFNEHYALTGGSDIDFFTRAAAMGSKHIWTSTAVVYEKIPMSRLTMKWQFQRLFRVGATNTHIAIQQRGYPYACIRFLPKIVMRLLLGPLLFITGGTISGELRLLSVHWIASSLGHTLGFVGVLGREYSVIHGY